VSTAGGHRQLICGRWLLEMHGVGPGHMQSHSSHLGGVHVGLVGHGATRHMRILRVVCACTAHRLRAAGAELPPRGIRRIGHGKEATITGAEMVNGARL
jgi:hypothetical protein